MTIYSPKEVANLVGKSEWTVRRWIQRGLIPFEKFPKGKQGRIYINWDDVPSFLKKQNEN